MRDIPNSVASMPDCHPHWTLISSVPRRCHFSMSARSSIQSQDKKYILRVIPGKKGASHKPVTKRTMQKPTPLKPTVSILFNISPIDIHLRCHSGHADRADAPADHHTREKDAWADLGQPQVSGQLSNEIADVESRNTSAPHRITHVEIRLQASQSCLTLVSALLCATCGEN
jgi:hypothetical protein